MPSPTFGLSSTALDRLLTCSLIYSPETEDKIAAARNLMLSTSGKYYIHHLVQHPQYLYNAVYDVPLSHASWKETERDTFAVRMDLIWELLTTVFDAEKAQLALVFKHRNHQELLGSIRHSGTLTRRLLNAASKLIDGTYYAQFGGPYNAGKVYRPKLQALSDNMESEEIKINEKLLRFNLIPNRTVSITTVEHAIDR